MTVVADLSYLTPGTSDYGMTICSLGIMGTKYELSAGLSIPTTISMVDKEQKTLTIPRIASSLTIGNTLDIKLRQGQATQLSWVDLKHSDQEIRLSPNGHVGTF